LDFDKKISEEPKKLLPLNFTSKEEVKFPGLGTRDNYLVKFNLKN
jgi:hypothetical protein